MKDALDAKRMSEAARAFEGLHDFASFADARASQAETRVKVESVLCRPRRAASS